MKTLINLDNCLPDYFQGHHNRVMVAYYDAETTIGDVLNQIEDDVINSEISEEFDGFSWGDVEKAMTQAKEENKDNLENKYMPDCDFIFSEDNENDCFPVAYFTLIEE